VADIRNTKKVRQLAAELRDECALRGVILVAGEAEEILALKIRAIANQLGVTERTVLDRYLPDDVVHATAEIVGQAGATYQQAVDAAGPVALDIGDAGRVIAALGMTMKLATEALEKPGGRADALGVATDCADAVVGIGVAIRGTGQASAEIEIGGSTLHARKVLQRTVELIRDGTWPCPCRDRHTAGATCRLQDNLISDLNLIGGWDAGPRERPARDR
jgi:hypothetical protein